MTQPRDPAPPDPPDLADLVRRVPLRQPDQRSCGAACLVVARLLLDPGYAALVAAGGRARWRSEVLGMHHRVTGPVDARGSLQLPWPQSLGTPPWAVAGQLSATGSPGRPPVTYRSRPVLDRDAAFDTVLAAAADRPVAVYVGNRWLPRHVVLAVAAATDAVTCYEPSRGELVPVDRDAFVGGRLRLAGWDRPWFVVAPG